MGDARELFGKREMGEDGSQGWADRDEWPLTASSRGSFFLGGHGGAQSLSQSGTSVRDRFRL